MIHRKWSLLTGPIAILGGVVGATVVAHFLFVDVISFGLSLLVLNLVALINRRLGIMFFVIGNFH